jgi:hypothetical protein
MEKLNEFEFGMIYNNTVLWHAEHFSELERKDNVDLRTIFKGNFETFSKLFIELRDEYIKKGIYESKEMKYLNKGTESAQNKEIVSKPVVNTDKPKKAVEMPDIDL